MKWFSISGKTVEGKNAHYSGYSKNLKQAKMNAKQISGIIKIQEVLSK